MSLYISAKQVKEKLQTQNFSLLLNTLLKNAGLKKHRVSAQIGYDSNYLQRQLKKHDQVASLLILLSTHLNTNLFEHYSNLLPENIRSTEKEKQLQQQIIDLQKQLTDVTRERDLLERIVTKA